jgi:SAM-dependent methyltransferase
VTCSPPLLHASRTRTWLAWAWRATERVSPPTAGLHLDVACGYATFMTQLGWRFPTARLVGLNIDFDGPHALAQPLLAEAGVRAALVQADARRLPFADGTLGSGSRMAVEVKRQLKPQGY